MLIHHLSATPAPIRAYDLDPRVFVLAQLDPGKPRFSSSQNAAEYFQEQLAEGGVIHQSMELLPSALHEEIDTLVTSSGFREIIIEHGTLLMLWEWMIGEYQQEEGKSYHRWIPGGNNLGLQIYYLTHLNAIDNLPVTLAEIAIAIERYIAEDLPLTRPGEARESWELEELTDFVSARIDRILRRTCAIANNKVRTLELQINSLQGELRGNKIDLENIATTFKYNGLAAGNVSIRDLNPEEILSRLERLGNNIATLRSRSRIMVDEISHLKKEITSLQQTLEDSRFTHRFHMSPPASRDSNIKPVLTGYQDALDITCVTSAEDWGLCAKQQSSGLVHLPIQGKLYPGDSTHYPDWPTIRHFYPSYGSYNTPTLHLKRSIVLLYRLLDSNFAILRQLFQAIIGAPTVNFSQTPPENKFIGSDLYITIAGEAIEIYGGFFDAAPPHKVSTYDMLNRLFARIASTWIQILNQEPFFVTPKPIPFVTNPPHALIHKFNLYHAAVHSLYVSGLYDAAKILANEFAQAHRDFLRGRFHTEDLPRLNLTYGDPIYDPFIKPDQVRGERRQVWNFFHILIAAKYDPELKDQLLRKITMG